MGARKRENLRFEFDGHGDLHSTIHRKRRGPNAKSENAVNMKGDRHAGVIWRHPIVLFRLIPLTIRKYCYRECEEPN